MPARIWASQGGFLSANQRVSDEVYPADHLRELTDAFDDAPVVVFDASDQMPPAIGSGLLWDGITVWIAGLDDYDAFVTSIDEVVGAISAGVPTPD